MTNKGDIPKWLTWALAQDTDDCLFWPFRIGTHGYGEMRRDDAHWLSHRWVCEQRHGAPPPSSDAAHECGHRTCANWKHLRWSTRKENHADKRRHGTHIFGEHFTTALLTDAAVAHIRAAGTERGSGVALALKFGVHPNTIYAARKRTWRHVP